MVQERKYPFMSRERKRTGANVATHTPGEYRSMFMGVHCITYYPFNFSQLSSIKKKKLMGKSSQ